MPPSGRETVKRLIDASIEQDFATVLELLAKDSFIQGDSGRIYIGHRGVSDWIRDFARNYTSVDLVIESIRELEHNYVLVTGIQRRTTVRGEAEAIPGTWLYHVADSRITAAVYFRTEADAIRSISGPGRGEAPTAVLERNLDAYNRRDFVALVSLTRPDVRFTASVLEPGDVRQGVGALARLLTAIDDEHASVLVESRRLTDLDSGFVLAEATIRIDHPDGAVDHRAATWLARIEDGQISEFVLYDDPESARAAAAARINV